MAPEQVRLLQRREKRANARDTEQQADEQAAEDDYYDESVDCWALGCIAYELLNGSPPFVDEDDDVLNALILNAPIDMVGTGSFLPESWPETYATADIVSYDGRPSIKVGREFLLQKSQRP